MLRRSSSFRSALVVVLLAAAIAMVGLLAAQAAYAYRIHREVAEAVLRDYARLAADELVRRASAEVGYRGYFAAITALQQDEAPGEIARSTFVLPRETAEIEGTPLKLGEGPFSVLHLGERSFVYAALAADASMLVGFEVERAALEARLASVVDGEPLLPIRDAGNEMLSLRLSDATGAELLARGELDDPELSVYRELGDTYSGIFEGMTLVIAVRREAAPQLIIGGLPRSRLPVLLSLLAITVGLLVAAIHQLRRERALTRLRAEFVSRVSHELRTPLTQIRMFTETLLLGRTRSEGEHRRSLEIVDQEARRLSQLVENILQFSRGDRGAIRLTRQPIELGELLRDIAEKFEPLARSRDARLALELDVAVVCLADRDAIRQIVLNLLDNAVKYGPSGQRIVMRLTRDGERARIEVEDEGPGVPLAERRRIWRRWRRLEHDERAAVAGSGIGLTVVRDLVAEHRGRVAVEEVAGGGARFVVELPLAEDLA